ncbi:Fe(3+) dicitrate transport protein [Pedobacter cryoconitis]|uniref:TonB-dependent receptor domain-containing protein n=1 Tax=Pedobacter cryoconitis TaxID=188932 RepID=UPI0016091650|nr:TonB-dependent receptor [Pedobacter cryoconitis]MBB6270915.1 Fe(3+) dicitrate transport protein [Pedobacter cryoconitis]
MAKRFTFLFFALISSIAVQAQKINISGFVKDQTTNTGVPYASLFFTKNTGCTGDSLGHFNYILKAGKYNVIIKAVGYESRAFEWKVDASGNQKSFELKSIANQLGTVSIIGAQQQLSDVKLQTQTAGTTIYAGKKNEIIDLNTISANTAINSTRQVYAKIPGVNIIENDEAGVQLSIATRGLNPNRTTEFNSRQNGYDISADPIGYPENYYTPPTDGLDNIEIIRGAASLQYGTQFGGLLNFKMKQGPVDKTFELVSKQTAGSCGFFNSFNSIGGQDKKLNYYAFYNFKRGDGWRQNTGFNVHNAYLSLKYAFTPKLTLGFEYTFMDYRLQQPGGLTDQEFKENPRQSLRNRNWFAATWNIPALTLKYDIDSNNLLSVKVYSLIADRKNVGDLNSIIYPDDPSKPRTVMNDQYRNYYMETRYIHHYELVNGIKSSFLAGVRAYHGDTHRIQGYNYTGSDANFSVRDNDNLQIDYRFPSYNAAAFAENVFQLTNKLSVIPGARFEYIRTNANGYTIPDTTTNIKTPGHESHTRKFVLLGMGLDYKISRKTDFYANFSQNYSPVSFTDIIISQPTLKVDPDLKDVKGYNFDLGYRGQISNLVNFDLSGFYLLYKNRIGTLLQTDGGGDVYQYETNISDSRSIGVETYAEINLLHLLPQYRYSEYKISLFGSVSYTNASYIDVPADRKQFEGKKVEYAAPWIDRYGIDFLFKHFSGSLQYSYTDAEFSDATNAKASTDGSIGIIPAYHVMDFTIGYTLKRCKLSFSVNNLGNEMYFTRRTTGFPGPGIIPSEGRAFYSTLKFNL